MKRQHITFIVLVLLTLTPGVNAQTTLALLPIDQEDIPMRQRLSDDQLYRSVLTRLAPLRSVHTLPFDRLIEKYQDKLVDDAVFELIVTGELDRSLARIHAWQDSAAWQQTLLNPANTCPADWLVRITILPDKHDWQITYALIDTHTQRTVTASSFPEVNNDPLLVSQELAKRLVRSLWKVVH